MQLSATAQELFKPKRNKILYGGRGGGKSHDVAGALLVIGVQKKMFIVCAREIQKSIKDSVHRLLKNKIMENPELKAFYTVLNDKITGANGTEFVFTGLKHDPDAVKSLEGADICWIEEAANVSERSIEILDPTIRKDGSEIWITFNPRYATDPVWVEFVVGADEDTFVKKVGWRDNPWFPQTMEKLRLKKLKNDPVAYQHIWEGEFDERFQGAVYASQLKTAREQGRISRVPYKAGIPVYSAWDLGKNDATSIWFYQIVGKEIRVLNFYETNNEDLPHYAEYVRSLPYKVEAHGMPHDSRHERLGMKGSIKSQLTEMGLNCVDVKMISEEAGIALARTTIAEMWFDEEGTKDGIHSITNFQYEWDDTKQVFKSKPKHDWSSHAADAFRYMAIMINNYEPEEDFDDDFEDDCARGGEGGWMR